MTTLRQEIIRQKLKRMQSYKRNCERAGRIFSGYLGVSYCNTNNRYRVYIGNSGIFAKYFTDPYEAALYYDETIVKLCSDAVTNKELGLL